MRFEFDVIKDFLVAAAKVIICIIRCLFCPLILVGQCLSRIIFLLNTCIKIRTLRQKTTNLVTSCMKTHILDSSKHFDCVIEDLQIPNHRTIFKIVTSSHDDNALIILTPKYEHANPIHNKDTIYV